MTTTNWEQMVRDLEFRYPELMNNVFLEVGPGWYYLLDNMCAKLYALGPGEVKLVQVKEKFALLCVHFEAPEELYNRASDIVHAAEIASANVCYRCSKSGHIMGAHLWSEPALCNICRDKKKEKKNASPEEK